MKNILVPHTHIQWFGSWRGETFLSISWYYLPNSVKWFTEWFQGSVIVQFFSVNISFFHLEWNYQGNYFSWYFLGNSNNFLCLTTFEFHDGYLKVFNILKNIFNHFHIISLFVFHKNL